MISTEDKQRIEAAAKAHSDKYTTSEQYNEGMFDGYVDGAEAEHERMAELLKEQIELVSTREAEQDVMAADTVRLMDQIEYQKKALKEDYDKITKLEFGLKEERNKAIDPEIIEALLACETTLKAFLPDAFATISIVEQAIKKAKGKSQ